MSIASETEVIAARTLLLGRATFDGWLVGAAAAPTDDLCAFYMLLTQPNATTHGQYLVEHGATGGIAYGLCLLWLVDRERFSPLVAEHRGSPRPINIRLGGCAPLSEPSTLGEVVRDIESGQYPTTLRRLCDLKLASTRG